MCSMHLGLPHPKSRKSKRREIVCYEFPGIFFPCQHQHLHRGPLLRWSFWKTRTFQGQINRECSRLRLWAMFKPAAQNSSNQNASISDGRSHYLWVPGYCLCDNKVDPIVRPSFWCTREKKKYSRS